MKQFHNFHLVNPSPWPLTSSLGAFFLTFGGVLYMHFFIDGSSVLMLGLICLILSCVCWWRDVIREATYEGNHTKFVQKGFLDFGNPVMAVKSGMIRKLKPIVIDESKVEVPVFPFRVTDTELLVPNGSHVAMTMIFDYHNKNHQKDRLLRIRKAKVVEVKTPRYLTVFLSPSSFEQK